ncbi:AAA family ATPase [Methanothrix sp.]|uniref:AAA family ATPase n=1 Tax=Methanothrix sp. TaxID=90426 RepID=UPI0034E20435
MRIIGFVGMPGSGKSVASDVAREMGIRVVVMGDVIRAEARRRGLEPTDANHGMVGDDLRRSEGEDAIAKRCLEGVSRDETIVVDGIRSIAEVEHFRSVADRFHLIEIFAPPDQRMRRIASRGRPDDSNCENISEAMERRDARELGWGMGEAIAAAEMRICNDCTLDEFRERIRAVLEELCRS